MRKSTQSPPNKSLILDYLNGIYAQAPGSLGVWSKSTKQSKFFNVIDEVADYLIEKSRGEDGDIYLNFCMMRAPPTSGRGKVEDVYAVPGLWLDLDYGQIGHKSSRYFSTESDALAFLAEVFPLPPTVLLHTGGGLLPIWLFNKPWILSGNQDRQLASTYSKRFQGYFIEKARAKGFLLDNTADLARVLRVPGTFNFKTGTPRPVILIDDHLTDPIFRYTPEKLLEHMEVRCYVPTHDHDKKILRISKSPPEEPKFFLKPILSLCPWMHHCQKDAADLSESEWYQMLTIVAQCKEAEEWAI